MEHVGVHRARVHGVAADLVLGVLARGHLREDPDGALAGGVGRLLVQRLADPGHRGDVDDRAAARPAHGRDRVLGAEEDAPGVDRHDAIPLGDGALLDRHARDDDGRVVDQDVELAVAADRRLHGRLPVGLAGHVQVHVHGVAAASADGRLDLLALVVPDVAEDDAGALLDEGLRLRRALPARPATDQCDLAVQLSHVGLLCLVVRQRAGAGCVAIQCRAMSMRRVNQTSWWPRDVVQRPLEAGGARGLPDEPQVQAERHHLGLRPALAVEHVEAVLHEREVVGRGEEAAGAELRVVGRQAVRHHQVRAIVHAHPVGQLVVVGVRVVEEAAFLDEQAPGVHARPVAAVPAERPLADASSAWRRWPGGCARAPAPR